jgi:anti-sigma factor RsiW
MMPRSRWSKTLRRMRGMIFNHVPLMITCQQLEDFIIDYLDGELPKRQKMVFELHLMLCPECRDYLAAYRQTMAIVKRVSENERPPAVTKMPEDLIKAIHAARQA